MKITNKLLLTVFAVFMMAGSLWGQDFTNNGGTYTATCNAVLKMIDDDSQLNGSDVLGSTTAIDGIVDWASSDGGAQTVQGLTYSYLVISGTSTKVVADGVVVEGGACATGFLAAYSTLDDYPYYNNGDPTYNGTFTYAPGTGVTQNIWPDDSYATLAVTGDGTANVLSTDQVTANVITSANTSSLSIAGDLILDGSAASTLSGDVAISGDGTFTGGPGAVTFDNTLDLTGNGTYTGGAGETSFDNVVTLNGAGATITTSSTGNLVFDNTVNVTEGTLSIPDGGPGGYGTLVFDTNADVTLTGDNSILDIGTNGNVLITGDITNGGDGTNLVFDCSSTVTYDGGVGQEIMPALVSNPYGNLDLTTGNKVGGFATNYGNDIALCQALTLTNLDLNMTTNSGAVIMTGADYQIAFTNQTEEIIGKVSRTGFNTTTPPTYYFNNAYTYATFVDEPTSSFTLSVEPTTNPSLITYDNTGDYNRNIVVTYSSTADVTLENLALGYEHSEVPSGSDQTLVRLVEGYNETAAPRGQLVGVVGSIIGLSGGETSANDDYASVLFDENSSGNYLTFPSTGTAPGDPNQVYNSSSLVMTTAPVTLISMRNGRWSDPGTWGGVTPISKDHAQIAHVVYTGIDGTDGVGAGDVFGNPSWDVDENDLPGVDGGVLAAYVEIDPNDVSGSRSVALVIGGNDQNMDQQTLIFGSDTYTNTTFTGVWNKNTTTNTWDGSTLATTTGIHGIYVMADETTNSGFLPTIRVLNGTNEGSVVNNAVIEVGND